MQPTINAQTIINEVMQAHACAPEKSGSNFFDKIKFKTSEKGFHTIQNNKENLQRFADIVRKNARFFGGGLIREEKQKPAITYPSKTITLFKQLMQDHDYSAALDLATDKLGAMFCLTKNGQAVMQVAPIPLEFDSRLVSAMNEHGTYAVIDPVSMGCVNGYTIRSKRNRAAQIAQVMERYSEATEEQKTAMFAQAAAHPTDQAALRAQWVTEHGITDQAAVTARIEAAAAQDVERMIEAATEAANAASTNTEAPAPQASEAYSVNPAKYCKNQVSVTTPSRDGFKTRAARLAGTFGKWSRRNNGYVMSQGQANKFIDLYAKGWDASIMGTGATSREAPATHEAAAAQDVERLIEAATQATEQQTEQATSEARELVTACEGVSDHHQAAKYAQANHPAPTQAQRLETLGVQKMTTGHPNSEGTRIRAAAEKIRAQFPAIAEKYEDMATAHDLKDKRDAATQTQEVPAAPSDLYRFKPGVMVQKISGKSGKWIAEFRLTPIGRFELGFKAGNGCSLSTTYATPGKRMQALQAMARAADTPTPPTTNNEPKTTIGTTETTDYTSPRETLGELHNTARDLEPATQTPEPAPTTTVAFSITITRVEGPHEECDKPATLASFADADALLMQWSETAPKTGGYNKCDFVIQWANGDTYAGRYDLKHHTCERPSVAQHMIDECEFHTGKYCPAHMSEAAYQGQLERISDNDRDFYAAILATMAAQGAYFPKVRPVAVDLRALMARGVTPEQFIGMGVSYCGDMCNASSKGAITATEPCTWQGLRVTVTLENGSICTARPEDFGTEPGSRYRLDAKMHGAPYLAQLAATVATVKANASAAKEQAAKAHAVALETMARDYSHLKQYKKGDKLYGVTLAAANVRILLKQAFPGVKFSVTCDKYSMGDSLRVSWTDGPDCAAVDAIVGKFSGGSFNSMEDIYEYSSSAFTELFGSAKHTSTQRELGDATISAALVALFGDNGPSVQDYRNSKQWAQVPHGTHCDDSYRDQWEWLAHVRRKANKTSAN